MCTKIVRCGLKWYFPFFLRFEKLIDFNIKNLKLYIEQDSFKKLKGEIYGMGYTSRCSGIGVLFKSVKIFLNKLVLIVERFWLHGH